MKRCLLKIKQQTWPPLFLVRMASGQTRIVDFEGLSLDPGLILPQHEQPTQDSRNSQIVPPRLLQAGLCCKPAPAV